MNSHESCSATRDSVLARLMDDYLASCEVGQPLTEEKLAGRYPELASQVAACLASLEFIRRGAASASKGNAECRIQNAEMAAPEQHSEFCILNSEFPILGDFRILREAGRGGMGIVYEAEQILLRRRVALKVLPFAAVLDPKQLQRFKNEALAAAQLDHPHIVDVLGVGQDRGTHFYAMRFIEGCTLADAITELADNNPTPQLGNEGAVGNALRGFPNVLSNHDDAKSAAPTAVPNPQSEIRNPQSSADTKSIAALLTDKGGKRGREYFRRAAALIADAADALEHAHSLGIVHRDIKPGNLLLDQAGKIWVSDFGLAHFADSATLTMTGDLVGTLRYMAPEQALAKHGLVDHRADIYALGCTLYELLTSYPVVLGTDRAQILHQIAFDEPLTPRKLNKLIPAELEIITLKCLAKAPDERFSTAGELAADLRRFLDRKAIMAKRPSFIRRAGKWAQRHQSLILLGVVTLMIGAAVSGWQAVRASRAMVVANKRLAELERERELPSHPEFRNYYVGKLWEQSHRLRNEHGSEEAEQALRRAVAVRRQSLVDFPNDRDNAGKLAVLLCDLAEHIRCETDAVREFETPNLIDNRLEEVDAMLDEASMMQRNLLLTNRGVLADLAGTIELKARHFADLAHVRDAHHRAGVDSLADQLWAKVHSLYTEVIAIQRELLAEHPEDIYRLKWLGLRLREQAEYLLQHVRYEAARRGRIMAAERQKARALMLEAENIRKSMPAFDQRDLTVPDLGAWVLLAGARELANAPNAASRAQEVGWLYDRVVGIRRRLASRNPECRPYRDRLLDVLEERAKHLLTKSRQMPSASADDAALAAQRELQQRKTKAASLVAEATELCKGLHRDFSDEVQYLERESVLEELQSLFSAASDEETAVTPARDAESLSLAD